MAITRFNPIVSAELTRAISPETMMHYAQNPDSPVTAILYPTAAERYFTALGDFEKASFSRRLRVENRLAIAFNVLFDAALFGLVDDLQNAWVDRDQPLPEQPDHMPEDYERASSAFQLAVRDACELEAMDEPLASAVRLARTFPGATGSLADLQAWTSRALERFAPDGLTVATRAQTGLTILGARLLWSMRIYWGTAVSLADAAGTLQRLGDAEFSGATGREEGFTRYARALVLLLNEAHAEDGLHVALAELEKSIACFRRSRGDFPYILNKRLSETHELIGRALYHRGEYHSAGYHFDQARELEKMKAEPGVPVARALKPRSKRGWRAAFRSLVGKG
jgi:tetratricopeptide (TPR) repeat protein